MKKIILASSSVTRAKILEQHSVEFIQQTSPFDEESITQTNPKSFVYIATKGKLDSFISKYKPSLGVLCADTVVVANNTILRKAKNKEDARKILNAQSGNKVSIITCMLYKDDFFELNNISNTDYIFNHFGKNDLETYLETNQWQGKAGACMVEGFCKKYIKEVKGLESNAKGLRIDILLPFLRSISEKNFK
jgi:septum formation protein